MEMPVLDEVLFSRGLISSGTSGALARFRKKLENREPVVYAAIGGSITEGASATDPSRNYASLFAAWLGRKTACRMINAGVGATSSMFGAFRAQQEMLCGEPDIVTVEFAVNDTTSPDVGAGYEALVRQCVASPKKPLVILLFTMRRDGMNLQDKHIPVGRHYGLPMLSYRDALYPEITAGKLAWETISPDEVHPNDLGHAFLADLLERFIDTATAPAGGDALPGLLDPRAARYLDGEVVSAARMKILENRGWTSYDHGRGYTGLESATPGSYLKAAVKSGTAQIGFIKYAGDFGKCRVRVDGADFCELDGFYEKPEIQKWAGGHTVLQPLVEAAPGTEHVIEIELLAERHPKSGGNRFKIGYILCGKQ